MNNKKELNERIENAEKELAAMKALLREPVWKPDHIYSGLHVGCQESSLVIIQQGYGVNSYGIYGCGSAFKPYSNCQNVSKEVVAIYLNRNKYEKKDDIVITNFK